MIDGLAARKLPVELQAAASRLQAAAHLEAAAQAHDVGRITDAQAHLESAGMLMGIDVEVTGMYRFRHCFVGSHLKSPHHPVLKGQQQ